ncbi:depupylase/deamidase Dop [Corynebacterium crudilactis]|uniref:Proteasome accessory factor PafA2 n=1 Tax=Corynebacterium crudilactis TaxID=1652495 RepID=A0A172QTK6_9CORY|nr:depupylase/deamidase Dop [Corynebacterium crudilactis]ANE04023.1 proteasome accessory factor PafA2 [Corynebacterium crudilactis]
MARFMGSETEYGISTPSAPILSPIVTSTHAVVAYSTARGFGEHRVRWDYAQESPLRDSRGFDLRRYHQAPVVDPHAIGVANVFVPNGARFYVDHAHPEYSSPEVTNAWDAMVYDAAGDHILMQAVSDVAGFSSQNRSVLDGHDPCPPLKIYKNNVDGKGASYGAHENYRYARTTDFDVLSQALIPFFVCRQIIIGAGRVGLGQQGDKPGFQISQRADYIEQEISLETTLNRGIINTRDEPHTDADHWGRLHVIIGDANMSQTANFLKFGMTSLVLDAIEAGVDFSELKLKNSVREVTRVSHDLTLTHQLTLAHGEKLTAIEILRRYLQQVLPFVESAIDQRVVALWAEVVDLLEADPLSTSHLLDWSAKLALIRSFESRGLAITDPKMMLIDLQYSDIDPKKSLYHALVSKNRMNVLCTAEEIAHAAATPPSDSRAFFRGRVMDKFGDCVSAANWESLIVRTSTAREYRVHTQGLDSLTQAEVGALVDNSFSIDELVKGLENAALTKLTDLSRR